MYKLFLLVVAALQASEIMSARIGRQADATPRASSQSIVIQQCIKDCSTTAEFNPVCGTDGQLYSNLWRLSCAQFCGVNVTLLRPAPCPLNL